AGPLRDTDRLRERRVDLKQPRTIDKILTCISPNTYGWDRERRRIDPVIDRLPFGWSQRHTGNQVGPLVGAVAIGDICGFAGDRYVERQAAAHGADTADSPTPQWDRAAERQWIAGLHIEILPGVKTGPTLVTGTASANLRYAIVVIDRVRE